MFSADDDESMLEESIRGDKAAIDEYRDVLEYNNLPIRIKVLLIQQLQKIEKDVRNNKSLQDLQ